ncbi:MAG: hypothetical protein AAB071_04560 [Bacteroidota bacterium]
MKNIVKTVNEFNEQELGILIDFKYSSGENYFDFENKKLFLTDEQSEDSVLELIGMNIIRSSTKIGVDVDDLQEKIKSILKQEKIPNLFATPTNTIKVDKRDYESLGLNMSAHLKSDPIARNRDYVLLHEYKTPLDITIITLYEEYNSKLHGLYKQAKIFSLWYSTRINGKLPINELIDPSMKISLEELVSIVKNFGNMAVSISLGINLHDLDIALKSISAAYGNSLNSNIDFAIKYNGTDGKIRLLIVPSSTVANQNIRIGELGIKIICADDFSMAKKLKDAEINEIINEGKPVVNVDTFNYMQKSYNKSKPEINSTNYLYSTAMRSFNQFISEFNLLNELGRKTTMMYGLESVPTAVKVNFSELGIKALQILLHALSYHIIAERIDKSDISIKKILLNPSGLNETLAMVVKNYILQLIENYNSYSIEKIGQFAQESSKIFEKLNRK